MIKFYFLTVLIISNFLIIERVDEAKKVHDFKSRPESKPTDYQKLNYNWTVRKKNITKNNDFVELNSANKQIYLIYNNIQVYSGEDNYNRYKDFNLFNIGEFFFHPFKVGVHDDKFLSFHNKYVFNYDNFYALKNNKYTKTFSHCLKISKLQSLNLNKLDEFSFGFTDLKYNALCSDTHEIDFVFDFKVGKVKLSGLYNTKITEADLNKDGILETYIFSYRSCGGELRIYQII